MTEVDSTAREPLLVQWFQIRADPATERSLATSDDDGTRNSCSSSTNLDLMACPARSRKPGHFVVSAIEARRVPPVVDRLKGVLRTPPARGSGSQVLQHG